MISLTDIVRRYLKKIRFEFDTFHFARVKVNTGKVKWTNERSDDQESDTRVVSMKNQTNVDGTGKMKIVKEGKPICSFRLDTGIIEGYEHPVRFEAPDIAFFGEHILAPVNKARNELVDTSNLTVTTTVDLASGNSAIAEVQHQTETFNGSFSCVARLSGNVVVISNEGEDFSTLPISRIDGFPLRIQMSGNLKVEYQDSHQLNIQP